MKESDPCPPPNPKTTGLFPWLALALAPVVTLYATQVVWLESLWAPLPWMATHGKAVGLFWLLFSSLSFTLYGLFRRLFPRLPAGGGGVHGGGRHQPV